MNKYPIVETLVFFCRYYRLKKPAWRRAYTHQLEKIRSCHSKEKGGTRRSFYTVETKAGRIFELEFDHEELVWKLNGKPGMLVDRVLVHVKRHKYLPSYAHRMIPLRFEIIDERLVTRRTPTDMPLIDRLQPYRFLKGKHTSIQVGKIETSHAENTMLTRHLHYVVEDTEHRFYHLVYTLDEMDWRFMQEVDREYLFIR